MRVMLRGIRREAEETNSYVLEPLPGQTLPAFAAGAHVEVKIAANLSRSYSLANDPESRGYYEIAVHKSPTSRGGSARIHDAWKVGQLIEISEPRNNFPLNTSADHTVLIAGGIGITPMLPMIATLERLRKSWEIHYVAATPRRAAFMDRLRAYPQAHILVEPAPSGRKLDLEDVCNAAPRNAHLYCCGPARMLDAFAAATEDRPKGHAHIEYFSADTMIATEGGYRLELVRSGKIIEVPQGNNMLDCLLGAGVDVGFACSEGVCGSCRVDVLGGIPDHRDKFLSEEEKASNATIMVCCSGSKTPCLMLDL
jgi:tetrachlorobenzoquinone reductase